MESLEYKCLENNTPITNENATPTPLHCFEGFVCYRRGYAVVLGLNDNAPNSAPTQMLSFTVFYGFFKNISFDSTMISKLILNMLACVYQGKYQVDSTMVLKLVTFRIDEEEWRKFQDEAAAEGESASSLLVNFCKWKNQGNSLKSPNEPSQDILSLIDAKIAAIAPDTDQRITASIAAAFSTFTPAMLEIEKRISSLDAKIEESENRITKNVMASLIETLGESLA